MNNDFNPNEQNTNTGSTPETPLYFDAGPLGFEQNKVPTGFAVASLVLGIISIVCCCLYPVALALGILAIVFAVINRRQAGTFSGLSTAGLVLGIVGTVLALYLLIDSIVNPVSQEELDALLKEYENLFNSEGGITTALRTVFRI